MANKMLLTNSPEELQHYLVVKGNDLIRYSRFSLTLLEQKVILYWVTKIKPNDTEFYEYEFDMNDFCDLCGITRNRKNRMNLEKTLVSLQTKNFAIVKAEEDIKETTWYTWFSHITFVDNSPKVKMAFDPALKPYLLGLKSNFTPYWLENILPMKSGYAIRLYEILKSYEYIGHCQLSLEELKVRLEAEYDRWENFKVRVIDKAIEEINEFTDIFVSYKGIKNGYSIAKIDFIIKSQRRKETAAHISEGDKNDD